MRSLIAALLLCSAIPAVRAAQSPADGQWAFEMNNPMGSVSAKVRLKADGGTLTGEFDLGGGRVWPLENGTIAGETITFSLDRDKKMTYEMKGAIKGDKIVGAAAAMGATVEWEMIRVK